jgi:serine/threonine protein kinase
LPKEGRLHAVGQKDHGKGHRNIEQAIDAVLPLVGSFGKVYKSYNLNDPSIEVAIKVIEKTKCAEYIETIMEEIQVLNILDHPNIVNHMETYDDDNIVFIGKYFIISSDHSQGVMLG